jgi:hypothetical protein
MKKLITLSNFATGTVKNTVTGEVKTVDTNLSEEERIELMAKNIAEQHNAAMRKLEKEEEEKWKANIFSNPTPIIQRPIQGKEGYYQGETVKFYVNGSKIKVIGSYKMACEIALHRIRDHIKDIINAQKCDDIIVEWIMKESDALGISKILTGNIEKTCCKICKWLRNDKGDNNICGNPYCGLEDAGHGKFKLFFHDINKCDFWEGRSYFTHELDYGVNIKKENVNYESG